MIEKTGLSFETYLAKFSSKARKNLRRSVKAVEEKAGSGGSWREYRTPAEVVEFYEIATAISASTYQSRVFHEGLESDEATRRHLEALAAENAMRGYLLFIGGAPAAFAFCEAKGDTLLYKLVGYRPEFAAASPGTVLLWHIIRRFFDEPVFQYLDFGEGAAFYKGFFATTSFPCARVYFFRRRLGLLIIVAAHATWAIITNTLRRPPIASSIIETLRRWVRRSWKAEGSEAHRKFDRVWRPGLSGESPRASGHCSTGERVR